MNTNVDFNPGGDNPLKGGFGYPLKGGGEKLEARSEKGRSKRVFVRSG